MGKPKANKYRHKKKTKRAKVKKLLTLQRYANIKDVLQKIKSSRESVSLSNEELDYCDCYKMLVWKTALKAESNPIFIPPVRLKPYFCGRCKKDFSPDDNIFLDSLLNCEDRKIICNEQFITKKYLKDPSHKHCSSDHRVRSLKSTSQENQPINEDPSTVHNSKEKRHICNICNKRFSKEIYLIYHSHVHTKEKSFFCSACNKSFSHRSGLSYHSCNHKRGKTYSCKICNKNFFYKNSLTVHSRFHSEEKPYSCSICDKKFSLKSNLTAHERIHTI